MHGWLYRRWYRSLFPIVVAALGLIAANGQFRDRLWRDDGIVGNMLNSGVMLGILGACVSITVAMITSMQMSAVVRAAFVLILWRLALLAHNDDQWIATSVFPEGTFFVVGALLAELLRFSTPEQVLTGSVSRGLGVSNRRGDWILFTSIMTYAVTAIVSRVDLRVEDYLREDFLLCLFTLAGYVASTVTRYSMQRRRSWRFHLLAAAMCVPILLLLLSTGRARQLTANHSWPGTVWFAAWATLAWYFTQLCLSRRLAGLGWHFKRRRERLVLKRNGEINFAATNRQDQHVASQGWTSIAGVFLLTAVCAFMPVALEALGGAGARDYFGDNLDGVTIGGAILIRILLSMAGLGMIAIVVVSVVGGLLWQSITTIVCFACLAIPWSAITRSSWHGESHDALIWASLAMPSVLCVRSLKSLCDRCTGFDVGVSVTEKRPLAIRSIMLLTLMTGVQIVLCEAIHWDLRLVASVLCISTLGILMTFFFVRRHLGNKTWINFLCVSIPTVGLIGGAGGLAAYQGVSIVLTLLLGFFCSLCFYGALWLSISWLLHVGWKPQRTKPSTVASVCETDSKLDAPT